MSPLLWIQRLFTPKDADMEDVQYDGTPDLEDESPFVFSQHMRIVTAILVAIISAFVMWWIMAS